MIRIGATHSISRTFIPEDIKTYLDMGGACAGSNTVPEPLIGGMLSYLLGVELPGPGTMYLKQETIFKGDAAIGSPLEATVEITNLRPEKKLIDLSTTCKDQNGNIVAEGRALVYLDREDWPPSM